MNNDDNFILSDDEILEVKYDRLFHDLFNEQEMDTIEWMVSKILECDIKIIHNKVRVGNIRLTNKSKDDKQKFVDLVIYLDQCIYVIEMNNNFNGNYLRNLLYLMNTINNSYIIGDEYQEKKIQGILVNLNWTKKDDIPPKEVITYPYPIINEDKIFFVKIMNINLSYYQNLCYNGCSDKDVLYKLLTRKKKAELKAIVDNEKYLTNYYNKMEYLSHDKEYCRMVWDERIERNLRNQEAFYGGKQEGIEEGLKEGKQEGLKEKQNEMIQKMYKNNIPMETIAKVASLTIPEVEKIIEKE